LAIASFLATCNTFCNRPSGKSTSFICYCLRYCLTFFTMISRFVYYLNFTACFFLYPFSLNNRSTLGAQPLTAAGT